MVDSICRDRADTQYMMIQNNLKNGKLITTYRSSLSIFTTNNMPNDTKKHCESTEPESCQIAKMFFFLSSSSSFSSSSYSSSPSSSDELVQNGMTLSQWFPHKTAAFYTEQCTSPSLFHNYEVSQGALNQSLKSYSLYGFICTAIFFNYCTHGTGRLFAAL